MLTKNQQQELNELRAAFPVIDLALKELEDKIKKSAGRPKKYNAATVETVQKLKKDGITIRKIAEILSMSTTTVQTIIKGYR